ncbi:MAG: hypothetical protein ACI97A_004140 [Planctomycetota bacterium]|jgi:hypothetical protein
MNKDAMRRGVDPILFWSPATQEVGHIGIGRGIVVKRRVSGATKKAPLPALARGGAFGFSE